jgi:RHS repeat-associated protein
MISWRRASLLAAGSVFAAGLTVAPVASAAPAPPPAADPSARPTRSAATAAARSAGRRIQVTDATTETVRSWANPDGTFTDEVAARPVRTRRGVDWVDVDTSIAIRDGAVRPTATVGDVAFSAGGDGALASMTHDGVSVRLGWGGVLPAPALDGGTARYPDVRPGTDLTLTALPDGFEQSYVLKTAAAAKSASSLRLPLSTPGLTARTDDGTVSLVDAKGAERAFIGQALMWDATGRTAPVGVAVRPTPLGQVLELTPDARFLADPSLVLPVTVDPLVQIFRSKDTYVNSAATTTAYGTNTYLKIGVRGTSTYNSYIAFNMSAYTGKDITVATMFLGNADSVVCTAKTTTLYKVNATWADTITWATQPSTDTTAAGVLATATSAAGGPVGSACAANGWMSFTDTRLTTKFQSWADTPSTNYGVSIRTTTDTQAAKDFASGESGSWTPRANITWQYYAPAAPTGLTATAGNQSAALAWTAADGHGQLTGNTVTVKSGGSTVAVYPLAGTATSYTVTGLTNGTAYTFEVTATNDGGTGPAAVSGSVTPKSVPLAPANVVATRGDVSLSVTWTLPDANGSPLTSQTITTRRVADGVQVAQSVLGATATSSTVPGLTNGTAYTASVSGTNALGVGAEGTSASVTPAALPGAPGAVTATPGNGQIAVTWTAAAANGDPVSAYTVATYLSSTGALVSTQNVSGTATSCSVTGLTNGQGYYSYVNATNGVGAGPAVTTGTVVPVAVPGAPTAVTGVGTYGGANVSWTAPASNGGSPITSYTVVASPGGASVSAAGTTATLNGLNNGWSYTFTVTATNAVGTGPASAASGGVVPNDAPPGAPTGGTVTAGDHAVTLTWTPPNMSGKTAITGYTVTAQPGGRSVTAAAGATSATVTGLTAGTTYWLAVVAKNGAGLGAPSTPIGPVTLANGPGAPTGVMASVLSTTSARVTWTAAPANGTTITGYRVLSSPGGACQETTGATTADVSGLLPGTAYVFRVEALVSGSGSCVQNAYDGPRSGPSASVTTPWSVPQNVYSLNVIAGNGAVTVFWLPTDYPVTSYVITANPGNVTRTVGGAAASAVLGGLTNGVAYAVTLTAVNPAGSTVSAVYTRTPTDQMVPVMETVLASSRAERSDISDDGKSVVWTEGGSGTETEPYLHSTLLADRAQQAVYLLGGRGSLAYDPHNSVQISGSGRYVFYSSLRSKTPDDANDYEDVYRLDRSTDTLVLVSTTTFGGEANGNSTVADVSPDGRYVLFSSSASNLVTDDSNGVSDLFLKDMTTGAVELVSVYSSGIQMTNVDAGGFVSQDGRYVVGRAASGGFWRDRTAHVTTDVNAPFATANGVRGLSRDGSVVTFDAQTLAQAEGRPGDPGAWTTYTSVYQRRMLAPTTGAIVVSNGADGLDLQNATAVSVSPDGELVLMSYQFDAVMRDVGRNRTSLVHDGALASQWFGASSIAGNDQTIAVSFDYSHPDREMRTVELLRDGKALGNVWWAKWRQRVNTLAGDYLESTVDASVTAAGPPLQVVRTYDSGNPAVGWFGTGFTSSYEFRLESLGTAVVAVFPDGRRETFTNDSTNQNPYVAPKGSASRLVRNGDGTFTLTMRDAGRAAFTAAGRLTALTDAHGHQSLVTYVSGRVSTVTDAVSGRALHFVWTGAHVTRVETDLVGAHGGPLAWTYTYTGDLLTQVCEPQAANGDTRCRANTYTGGRLTESFNALGQRILQVAYQADGRVSSSATDGTHATTFAYVQPGVTQITDALGRVTRDEYDSGGRLAREVDANGKSRLTTYDSNGWPATATDENGTVTTTVYSSAGDLLSEKRGENAGVVGAAPATAYLSYDTAHNVLTRRDPRSGSASDSTYLTSYVYDAGNNVTSETGPPVAGFPSGASRTWAYSAGTESAIGGGTVPAGLLLTATDARGKLTRYRYASNGDLREVENAAGMVMRSTYDELGRVTTRTDVSAAYPAGTVTTFTYDELSRAVIETGPLTHDAVTNAAHQLRTTRTYDRADRLVRAAYSDAAGTDATRATDYVVDPGNRVTSATDAQTNVAETYEYDGAGNLTAVVDRLARRTEITYTSRNQKETVRRMAVLDRNGVNPRTVVVQSYTYDDAGRRKTATDVLGRVTQYGYDTFDRSTSETLLGFVDPNGSSRDVVGTRVRYDAAGNLLESWRGSDLLHETFTVDAMNRVTQHVLLNTNGVDRTTTSTYDGGGLELTRTLSGGGRTEQVTRTFDSLGHPASETVENGATDLTTWFRYDDRGLLTATTDARGTSSGDTSYTTDLTYDEAGRPVSTALPSVSTYTVAGGTVTTRPTTTTGYDSFGEQAHLRDARGSVVTATYDKLGRRTRVDQPSYTRPSDSAVLTPYETWTYDNASRVLSSRDRRAGVTTYRYDGLDHLVGRDDPAVAAGTPSWSFTSDDSGRVTATTDPVGAVVNTAYDKLDRVTATTDVVRSLTGGATVNATTKYQYDDMGRLTRREEPSSTSAVWSYSYEAAGNVRTVTDPLTKVTSSTYDVAGRLTSVTDPLTRKTENVYDLAGRRTDVNHYDATPVQVSHESAAYDNIGNPTTTVSARLYPTYRSYDRAGRLSTVTTPLTATTFTTTGFAYDAGGLVTRTTDGRGYDAAQAPSRTGSAYDVQYTYNAWGAAESTVEPSTSAHPATADRTWTTSYDDGGLPVTELRPGGVQVTRTYDALGRMTAEHGAAVAGAPTVPVADRTLGYDLAGLLRTVGHPGGNLTYTYDDRGDLATAAGPAGATTVTRDVAGRPTSIADPAGTHAFTWTLRNELDTETDPLTAVTIDRDYDNAGQLSIEKLGTAAGTRKLTYDALGRITNDQVENSAAVVQTKIAYGYDADGNVTSQNVTAAGNAGAGNNGYTYDRAGRLTTWTKPSAATESYTYDAAGNRTSDATGASTYDARGRLLTSGTASFAWSPRGTLASRTPNGGSAVAYAFDGLDRMVTAGATSYAYDSLDRVASTGFAYTGLLSDPTTTPTTILSRSVSGNAVALSTGGVASLVSLNGHGDVAARYNAAGTVSASKTYEPFGNAVGTVGSTGDVGFQADFRDSGTGLVWMGARWYDPASGTFTARDSMARHTGSAQPMNRYSYGDANPVTFDDPDGHCAATGWGGCSLDVGPTSYTVEYAAGAFLDSSRAYSTPPPAKPSDFKAIADSMGFAEDPDIAVLYRYHLLAGAAFGAVGGRLGSMLDTVAAIEHRLGQVWEHRDSPVQMAQDLVNLVPAAANGIERFVEDLVTFGSYLLHKATFGKVPEVNFHGWLPRVGYAFNDARSKEFSSLAEDIFTFAPPIGTALRVIGKVVEVTRIAALTEKLGALRGLRAAGEAEAVAESAAGIARLEGEPISSMSIRFSQTSVNDVAQTVASMSRDGWVGDAIDVVRMPDGGLTAVDNSRVLAAHLAEIDVRANVRAFDDVIADGRGATLRSRKGVVPTTWGEGVDYRIARQSKAYRTRYPQGSPIVGWDGS